MCGTDAFLNQCGSNLKKICNKLGWLTLLAQRMLSSFALIYSTHTSEVWPLHVPLRCAHLSIQAHLKWKQGAAGPTPVTASLLLSARLMLFRKNLRNPSLGKKSAKVLQLLLVQQCRWHSESKCFLGYDKIKNNPFKPSLSNLSLPL